MTLFQLLTFSKMSHKCLQYQLGGIEVYGVYVTCTEESVARHTWVLSSVAFILLSRCFVVPGDCSLVSGKECLILV